MPKNQEFIKNQNIELVLNTLFDYKTLSRAELSEITKLSPPSITRVTQFLIEKGYICEEKFVLNKAGRNPTTLHIIPGSAYTIGIEILKDSLIFALSDLSRQIILTQREQMNYKEKTIEEIGQFIKEKCHKILSERDIAYDDIVGIGIAIPGIVNHNEGIVNYSTQLGWENVNVSQVFGRILNKHIILENDAKARMVAKEKNRKLLNNDSIVGLFIGEGVSAVGVSEGSVVRGINNAAGEVGHIITTPEGIVCDCGSRGCLQTNLSTKFLLEKAREHKPAIVDIKEILTLSEDGVQWAEEIINSFKSSVLLILDILQHCYNPSFIILSGEIMDSFEEFLRKFTLDIKLKNRTTSSDIQIVVSTNNVNEPAIGVALLSFGCLLKYEK